MKRLHMTIAAMVAVLSLLSGCTTTPATPEVPLDPVPAEEPVSCMTFDQARLVQETESVALPEPEPTTIKLSIVGDCLVASDYGNAPAGSFLDKCKDGDWEWFLGGVADYFRNDDFTIVNLENVLTDKPLTAVEKNHNPAYWYKAPTENMQIFTSSSVEVVNLSNNHTGDYGQQGAADTIAAAEEYGVEWGNSTKTVYLEKDGFTIALICNGLWYEGQTQEIFQRIEEAEEKSDFQIVYYHGGTERVHQPEDWRVRSSRALVEAGADLVIGNHPHVLQPMEEYHGATIIYSMGNFCWGASKHPENATIIYQCTLSLLDGELTAVSDDIIPCYVYTGQTNNWRPEVMPDGQDKQVVLDFMAGLRDTPVK